jgi:hypothetical protein
MAISILAEMKSPSFTSKLAQQLSVGSKDGKESMESMDPMVQFQGGQILGVPMGNQPNRNSGARIILFGGVAVVALAFAMGIVAAMQAQQAGLVKGEGTTGSRVDDSQQQWIGGGEQLGFYGTTDGVKSKPKPFGSKRDKPVVPDSMLKPAHMNFNFSAGGFADSDSPSVGGNTRLVQSRHQISAQGVGVLETTGVMD